MSSKTRSKSKKHTASDEPSQVTSSWHLTPSGWVFVIGLAGVVCVLTWLLLGPGSGENRAPRRAAATPAAIPAAPAAKKVEVAATNPGTIEIPLTHLRLGEARHFEYSTARGPIRFFAVRTSDVTVRTALDECDTCNSERTGYAQSGSYMVCRSCGKGVPIGLVGEQPGGCNPIPLPATMNGENVVIEVESLT